MQPKENVGLVLGPALFLLVVALPEPSAMVDAARFVGASDFAPQVAFGTLLWVLAWWLAECVPLGLAAFITLGPLFVSLIA